LNLISQTTGTHSVPYWDCLRDTSPSPFKKKKLKPGASGSHL
jgi:hypothetical protein